MKKTILLLMVILSMAFVNKVESQVTVNAGWGFASIENETFNGLEVSGTYNFENNIAVGAYYENLHKDIEGYNLSLRSYGGEVGYIASDWVYLYSRFGASAVEVEHVGDASGTVLIFGTKITPFTFKSKIRPYVGANYSFFNYDGIGSELNGFRLSVGLNYTF